MQHLLYIPIPSLITMPFWMYSRHNHDILDNVERSDTLRHYHGEKEVAIVEETSSVESLIMLQALAGNAVLLGAGGCTLWDRAIPSHPQSSENSVDSHDRTSGYRNARAPPPYRRLWPIAKAITNHGNRAGTDYFLAPGSSLYIRSYRSAGQDCLS